AGRITMYCRIDQQDRLVFGGRGPMCPTDGADRLPMLTRYAERLWPALQGTRWTHGWNGCVAVTPDHWPHLHVLAPGLFACLGYNGRGVALSTAMGGQLARRLIDPDADLDMPISDLRPMALHRFWPLGVRAAVAKGRVLDRFGL
ncbi:MAG TPA: FAD-binding oxidoreductase, partial [Rhodopila sp.]|uniref:NAD(P)/FAD-dependent oxidoreductase n=1 Tax=Rhodopila sp. TaxID=2480087 RepID=UPI002C4C6D6B